MDARDQRQRGHFDRARHAYRRSHRRANRRGCYARFRRTKNSARVCAVTVDWRSDRYLHAT